VRALLDVVFPPRCAGCDRPGDLLCCACREALSLIDQSDACRRCGAPHGQPICSECGLRDFAFEQARCASLLAYPVSRAIVVLKDGGERRYAALLAEMLAQAAEGWLGPEDLLVPVPASPQAVRRRGFDHAVHLARALGAMTGNPVQRVLLATPSADQRTLGRMDRFTNRAGAFAAARTISGAQVVLVDDVFTTGATLDAAARTLRAAGAARVRALAVARACREMSRPGVYGGPAAVDAEWTTAPAEGSVVSMVR
jgi:ComF family protein